MSKLNILITSPSINTKHNVSGIANLTRLLIKNNKEVNYVLFVAGKKDSAARGFKWFFKQFSVVVDFYKLLKQDIDFVHLNIPFERIALLRDYFFSQICLFTKTPYIAHIRGGEMQGNTNTSFLFKKIIHKILKNSEIIIVLGKKEKEFISSFYRINKPVKILPNAVIVKEFKQKQLLITGKLNLLFLGRIDKNKGLKEIIDSLSSLNSKINYCLHIAGEGPDKIWFLEECDKKINNKFKFYGVVSGEAKNELFSQSHVFLLPSYYEGLPNALLESMSYGCVPIVTPVGSIPEVVDNGKNGLIIPVHNSKKLEETILSLSGNNLLFEHLGQQAYLTIKEKYSLSNYIEQLNQIYSKVV